MSSGRILIVDDDTAFVEALAIYLEDHGFIAVKAFCGRQGIAEFSQQYADLMLVDLHLPDMDGLDVVEQLRRSYPWIPVVLISSDDSPESLRRCAAAAWPCVFMTKPLAPESLLHTIMHMLGTAKHVDSLTDK